MATTGFTPHCCSGCEGRVNMYLTATPTGGPVLAGFLPTCPAYIPFILQGLYVYAPMPASMLYAATAPSATTTVKC